MALRYRVAKLFAHEGRTYTNAPKDLEAVKKLPRKVRDHHIDRGNLVEWDDDVRETPPPAESETATPKKES